ADAAGPPRTGAPEEPAGLPQSAKAALPDDAYGALRDGVSVLREGFRRVGPDTVLLDGAPLTLREAPGEGERTVDTLLFAVRPVAGGTPAGAVTGTAAEFRAWLEGVVTADDVTGQDVPSLEADRALPLDLLDRIGASLSVSVRTEAMLLGDRIPASRVELTPVQRLRVLLADPSYGAGTTALPMGPLAAAAARGLGVTVAVVGPDDEVTYHGGHGDG
ncbi:hypothetical protein G3I27_26530, partial [Streptomyces sp. SID10692]|nr:hypothetical protein [Streptomyces sp. SID10692]